MQFAQPGLTHAVFLAAGSWHPEAVALQAGADTGARAEEGADTGGRGPQEAGAQAGEGEPARWPRQSCSWVASLLSRHPRHCIPGMVLSSLAQGSYCDSSRHKNATLPVAFVLSSAQDPEHFDSRRKSERRQRAAMRTWRSAPRSRTCRRTRFGEKQTTPRGSERASLTRPRPTPSVRHPLSKDLHASLLLACAMHVQYSDFELSSPVSRTVTGCCVMLMW